MQIGMVGLGKMGMNMAVRLARGGHEVIAFDSDAEKVRAASKAGLTGATTLAELLQKLEPPRAVWIMVPEGRPVDAVIALLKPGLVPGDIVVDGGNSNYKDSARRAKELTAHEVHLVDVGTSGGIWGLENGFCLMVGGHHSAFLRLEPALETLAPPQGYAHLGASGAGHYAKMIHNGIEYGLMQAYAEGFDIMKASDYELDLTKIAGLWQRGSVVRSWLLELMEAAFKAGGPALDGIRGYVEDSGEGRWTVAEAIDRNVPAPVITASLLARLSSRQKESFSAKVVAALRNQFGGHAVKKSGG